ncbi:MAG: MGMT family protein [Candidatus Lokiarchaeota archaeon]|nr:MGMT family protein [Candidatus Lokiarchaeota archaeon]
MALIKKIPQGKVSTYGDIAKMAGNPRAARQVVRILHSMTQKYHLPWHRVVNSQGKISIKDPIGTAQQKTMLELEGVEISDDLYVNLEHYNWNP